MPGHNANIKTQTLIPAKTKTQSHKGGVSRHHYRKFFGVDLTPKQMIFVREMALGKTGVEAAMKAYDTDNLRVAASMASENLAKPNITEALSKAYDRHGLNVDSVVTVLTDAMKANKLAQFEGETYESKFADHGIRLSAARTAMQLIGAGKNKDPDGNSGGITFNITKNTQNNYLNKP